MHPLHFDLVGFWLPCSVALFFSIGICKKMRCRDGLLWLAATLAAFAMTEVVDRRVFVGTAYCFVAIVYLLEARFRPSRPPMPARLVFGLMFFSVLVPDVLVARFAPLPFGANQATVGGMGLKDGLLLQPLGVGLAYFLPYWANLDRQSCREVVGVIGAHWWPFSPREGSPVRPENAAGGDGVMRLIGELMYWGMVLLLIVWGIEWPRRI